MHEALFPNLGFDVNIHENLTGQGMIKKAESYSKMEHKGVLFFIILSHGLSVDGRHAVTGTDGKSVKIDKLESFFHTTNCNSLHGKPRIFMIDACRGSQTEKVFKPEPKGTKKSSSSPARAEPEGHSEGDSAKFLTAAPEGDSVNFMLIHASTHGKAAFTDKNKGSRLTQAFVEVMNDPKGDPNEPLTKIIKKVTKRVQEFSKGEQIVAMETRMTRDYNIR